MKREQDDTREGGREYFRGIGGGGTSSLPLPVRGQRLTFPVPSSLHPVPVTPPQFLLCTTSCLSDKEFDLKIPTTRPFM